MTVCLIHCIKLFKFEKKIPILIFFRHNNELIQQKIDLSPQKNTTKVTVNLMKELEEIFERLLLS